MPDPVSSPAPAPGVTPPAGPAPTTTPAPGATPGAPAADPWKEFQDAAAAYDGPGIQAKWAALSASDKKKLKTDGDTQMHVVTTLHKDAVPILGQGDVDFTAMQTVFAAYISADFGEWMAPLKAANIFDAFLAAPPKNGSIPIEYAKKLGAWINTATTPADAKKVFAHVYQPAQDTYSRSGWTVTAVNWTV